jgi:hypothetical protein
MHQHSCEAGVVVDVVAVVAVVAVVVLFIE